MTYKPSCGTASPPYARGCEWSSAHGLQQVRFVIVVRAPQCGDRRSRISGLLFSADIDRFYEALQLPVWLA